MPSIIALADDLSGAAETAAALGLRRVRNLDLSIRLDAAEIAAADVASLRSDSCLVVDTDSRALPPVVAAARVTALASAFLGPGRLVLKKTDSLLRGNLAAELAALHAVSPVVFVPAIPALRRTVVGGRLFVDGAPLHTTSLWHAEAAPPPERIADLFTTTPCAVVGLPVIRGPREELQAVIRRARTDGALLIADGESDSDVAAVVAAALDAGTSALAGPSSVAAALGADALEADALDADAIDEEPWPPVGRADVLIVVGSASAAARRQLEVLERQGVPTLRIEAERLLTRDDPELTARLAQSTDRVLAIAVTSGRVDPSVSSALASALGGAIARGARDRQLVLTGGETARRVLDALGVRELRVLAEIEHGAVLLSAADGRRIVTRPGSFGDDASLATIVTHLLSTSARADRLVEHHATERKHP